MRAMASWESSSLDRIAAHNGIQGSRLALREAARILAETEPGDERIATGGSRVVATCAGSWLPIVGTPRPQALALAESISRALESGAFENPEVKR